MDLNELLLIYDSKGDIIGKGVAYFENEESDINVKRTSDENSGFSTYSLKVKMKKIEEKDVSYADFNNTSILDKLICEYLDILNDNVNHNEIFSHETIINANSQMDIRKLVARIAALSNMIAVESRIGGGNILIIPKKYNKLSMMFGQSIMNLNLHINDTDKYQDTIFVTRKNTDITQTPSISLITDKSLLNYRRMKINKIKNNINGTNNNYESPYMFFKLGDIKYIVNCIKIQ